MRLFIFLKFTEDISYNIRNYFMMFIVTFFGVRQIKTVNIADVPSFSDYSGPPRSAEAGTKYFVNKFLARNNNSVHEKEIETFLLSCR